MTINRPLPLTSPAGAPATAPVAQPLDLIFIEGFVGETVIGIHVSELHRPQPIVIDVHAGSSDWTPTMSTRLFWFATV